MAWDPAEVLQRAAGYLETFQFDLASKFCQRIIDEQPDNLEALELMAGIQMEMGMIPQAYELLLKSVQLSPERGYQKYLAMGQLCRGADAVTCYRQGIRLLEGEETDEAVRGHQTAAAWCAIVEVYMTDLCDEEEAESQCEQAIQLALNANPQSIEAYRTLADLRLVQQRPTEAAQALSQAMGLIRSLDRDSLFYPAYDERSSLARLFIETGRPAEAMEVLEGLIAEDDEVIDTWYLMGVCGQALQDRDAVIEAFSMALRLKKRLGDEDQEQAESIQGILSEMGIGLEELDLKEEDENQN